MKDNCKICQLDLFIVDRVKKRYLEGDDPEDIALNFGLSMEDTKAHCQSCVKKPKSTQARYRELIDQLEDDIAEVRLAMTTTTKSDDENESDKSTTVPALVQGYARLVSEYKDAIIKVDEMTKPEDRVKDTIIQVINPFLREMLRNITEEVNKLKAEMRVNGIPSEVYNKLLEEFFKRTAEKLKLASSGAVDNLNGYFGATSTRQTVGDDEKTIQ